ncbi:copper resistance CopC/CopD family protein [Mesorhizobium sp. SP-1A]|uniref:copper resistance CopC/CopD family protein n=1 Tax=Mesorhizobium sp. SP-1A TaxID=3077840 RepID=UPI0028F727F2|nr:CopD family protein [Mesorhizobium sp. SP-1A]
MEQDTERPVIGTRGQLSGQRWWRCHRLAHALLFFALALPALFVLPNAAFAHAALIATQPDDGAVLAESPRRFSLQFSEPVSPLVLTLVRPDGTPAQLASFRLDGQTVDIDAPSGPAAMEKGSYVLSWRVISADGHPVAGSILFSIGAPSAAPVAAEAVDWALRSAIWFVRTMLYAALFLGIGGAFAIAWLGNGLRDGSRVAGLLMLLGLVAAPVALGLQGLDALGAPLSRFADPAMWRAGGATTYGWTVLIALIALLLGLSSLALPRLPARLLSLIALGGVGAALAASGHASAAEPQWLTRPMVFLHAAGIAFWTGALMPLGLTMKRRGAAATPVLLRFSSAILPVAAVFVLAGIVLAVIQVQTPAALLDTAYGKLLLAKLALLAVLFVIAAWNRWRLTRPAEAGDAEAQGKLVRSIVVEMLLVLAIFGVVAGWRFTPPPRALAIAAAQPASTHIHTLKAMADLSISPGHAGPVTASIVVMTGDFGPLPAKEVTLELSKPDAGIGPLKRPARKMDDGTWRVEDLVVPVPGRWVARIDILISDFDMAEIEGPIDIRP